jgi:hypothetical protein
MTGYVFKIALLAALFVALCVKGGQISSADGVMAMTRLAQPTDESPRAPETPRSVEEDFRGISPLPAANESMFPAKRVIKHPVRKVVRQQTPSVKDAARKSDRKG